MANTVKFKGAIPQHYEDILTPFLFEDFAKDIAERVAIGGSKQLLELAAGTGCVTRHLVSLLPATTELTVSDLQPDMLEVARKTVTAANIRWAAVDMMDIPYEDNLFDGIVCQFGLMLVPDKLTALKEMYRVLKPGGRLVFNVWGPIGKNDVWNIASDVIGSFLENNPMLQDPGPFSLDEPTALQLLKNAGFSGVGSTELDRVGIIEDAAMAAKGLIEGLPVALAIQKNDPSLLQEIRSALGRALIPRLGNHPLRSSLQALVFEAYKQS